MATTIFICSQCDAQSPKWAGRCLSGNSGKSDFLLTCRVDGFERPR
ncbi:hypothetical protein HY732_02195 [Candidatus Uhrbacteria bacterium]|nr:hypothetical protein [Candidatus Uhrbacteria bacterium]